MGKSTISMAIFNSYVSHKPEGKQSMNYSHLLSDPINGHLWSFHSLSAPAKAALLRACDDIGICGAQPSIFSVADVLGACCSKPKPPVFCRNIVKDIIGFKGKS